MSEKRKKIKLTEFSSVIAFLVIFFIAILVKGSTFLSVRNITNILLNNAVIGIISLGMTMIIITGGIDLSVGSQLAMAGLIGISVLNATNSILLSILSMLAIGVFSGFVSGFLISKFNVPAFIVTLGATSIYRSLSQYFYHGGGILAKGSKVDIFLSISNTKIFGIIPMPVLFWLVLALIIGFMMKRTSFGRYIYGSGSNEQAARLSGVNTKKIIMFTYVVSGLLVAFAALIDASRLGSMNSASSGLSYDMDSIAAVVIGGTRMSGGHGSIVGTIFGTLTLGIINNMLNLLGVNSFLVGAIKGAIIICAVLLQKYLEKKEA